MDAITALVRLSFRSHVSANTPSSSSTYAFSMTIWCVT